MLTFHNSVYLIVGLQFSLRINFISNVRSSNFLSLTYGHFTCLSSLARTIQFLHQFDPSVDLACTSVLLVSSTQSVGRF